MSFKWVKCTRKEDMLHLVLIDGPGSNKPARLAAKGQGVYNHGLVMKAQFFVLLFWKNRKMSTR